MGALQDVDDGRGNERLRLHAPTQRVLACTPLAAPNCTHILFVSATANAVTALSVSTDVSIRIWCVCAYPRVPRGQQRRNAGCQHVSLNTLSLHRPTDAQADGSGDERAQRNEEKHLTGLIQGQVELAAKDAY